MNDYHPIFSMRAESRLVVGLKDLCDTLNYRFGDELKVMVEVGSFLGESADYFLKNLPNVFLHCIDPWLENYDNQDPASRVCMSEVEQRFDEWAKHQNRVKKWKGVSQDFSKNSEFKLIDVVYIDGCHTYEAVKNDINFWKSRTRLAIAGHDYGYTDWLAPVTRAVDEAVGRPDKVFADSSWIKFV